MPKARIKREFSAGGVVFRKEPEGILWLIVKPRGSEKWRFPKGHIESNENSVEAAIREVAEEAGVETEVLEKIGNEKYFFVENKQKIFKTVVFYLMEYVQEAREGFNWETEEIDWLLFEEVEKKLAFPKEKEILKKAQEFLQREIQEK